MNRDDKKNNRVVLIGMALIAMVFAFTIFRPGTEEEETKKIKEEKSVNYPQISPEDLKKDMASKNDSQIIDFRSADDYKVEHLIGSINVISAESLMAVSPEKTAVIVADTSNQESIAQAFDLLKKNKFKDVLLLSGGISAWKKTGGATISIGNPESFLDHSKVSYISSDDLKKELENKNLDTAIIDIRAKQSFDSGHIPGAENVYLEDLERSREKIPSGKRIIVYGDTETQGFQAGVRLYDLNFFSVKVLEKGFTDWKNKGFQVEK